MSVIEATKVCLRKYITFSGRASRVEFWKFMLAIVIISILASVANAVVFGPVTETQFVVRTTSEGTTQGLQNTIRYGPGPFSTFIGLAVLLPFFAAASRRMHDIGRPGWHLVLLWVIAIALMAITLLAFQVEVPVSEEMRAAYPSLGPTMAVPQPPLLLFLTSWLTGFASIIVSIVWLARRGQHEPNRYGPNPMELTS